MNQAAAVVLSQTGQLVRVSIDTKFACSGCQVKSNCGGQAIVATAQTPQRILEIKTHLTFRPGDAVVVQIPEGYLTSIAMVVYWVPLIGFIVGLLVGASLVSAKEVLYDAMVLAFGVFGGSVGWLGAKRQVKTMEQTQQSTMTAKLGQIIHQQTL